jgi:putative membrane protein
MMEAFAGIYCGPPPTPEGIWAAWNLDPIVLAALSVVALVLGRSRPGAAAVAVLAIVFVSPLCALSSALFAARTVHHVLLVAVAAPLLAAAWPAHRPRAAGLPFAVSTALLWLWHLPAAYDLALSNMAIYWAMQLSLLVPAVLFWRAVLAPAANALPATLYVVGGYMQMALLGALLTFAPDALYAIHQTAPLAFGLSPLADQQLGGLIMWVPAGLPYAVAGALLARRAWAGAGAERRMA